MIQAAAMVEYLKTALAASIAANFFLVVVVMILARDRSNHKG